VGKTYEMLTTAQARLRDGVDVVAGVVETHGRAETRALLDGLPTVAMRRIDYKGRVLEEMDLDAILARKPALVLVDELAHSNAPGSRHPKRYLDVLDLLAAGIDVYTTLNIQHVESLNDVVAQITRIRVRETVPDSIVDRADEIEVIDITPDDLLKRLREGKVYVARTAERAMAHYFSPGNLTALRELALRRTAQMVDAQLLDHMQAHAIQGPWAAGDRVLVCVDASAGADALVRYAKRLAERLRAAWVAVHVETPADLRLPQDRRDAIAETMRLAERLGAEAVTIPGLAVAAEVLAYARAQNATHIVLGHAPRRWWGGSVAQRVIDRAGAIAVHVVGSEEKPRARSWRLDLPAEPFAARPYLASAALVAAAVGVGALLRQALAVTSLSLVFLTAVLASAAAFGLFPSLFACILSVLAYNFFFLPPLYTFTIADPENVVALFFFTLTALVASNLAARVRAQAVAARARARTAEELYGFSRKLAGIGTLDDLLWATAYQVAAMLGVRVVLLLPDGAGPDATISLRAFYPPDDEMDEADIAAARWCWQNNRPAGRGADTLPGGRRLFLPLATGRGCVGVMGIEREGAVGTQKVLTPDQFRLLGALADQAAVSIERVQLAEDVDRARLAAETERLRGALLTSISHDLRTPLSAIMGAASSLEAYRAHLDAAAQAELLRTIQEEAERMNRFIANLLDMTRLESGAVAPRLEAADIGEVIGSALARAGRVLAGHAIRTEIAAGLPLVALDVVLFEQVLFNLLDNAAKYTPAGTTVTLRAASGGGMVDVEVVDEGPGIPPEDLPRLFDKFFRAGAGDRQRAGTGLGLAVCRGFVEAMGGRIEARNRTDRSGAVFAIRMRVEAA
jgi:two-component system sensor histidine kinase KdpD